MSVKDDVASVTKPGASQVGFVAGLTVSVVGLLLAAIIGGFAVAGSDDGDSGGTVAAGTRRTQVTDPNTGEVIPGDPSDPSNPGDPSAPGDDPSNPQGGSDPSNPTGTDGPTGTKGPTGGTTPTTGDTATTARPTSGAGDRTGVTSSSIRWAIHAPETFGGAPVNLAEDTLTGVQIYLKAVNDAGGINGRKIESKVYDDTYTVQGATTASKSAINDYKPFFVSGTLGVDQVAVFAAEAKKRGVPYIAAGGAESAFKDIGMFQVSSSYDSMLTQLAAFLAAETKRDGSPYKGLTKVGVTQLDSEYIAPSVTTFGKELQKRGLSLVKVIKVKKPTEQTTYAGQLSELRNAGVQILVPAQDPITTSREVQECKPATSANPTVACPWKWTFANFAHDGNVPLALMGGSWTGVRGLSGACEYTFAGRDDPAKCAKLGVAHEQWVKAKSESDWQENGSGGQAGYGLVHIWLQALKAAGPDPTRERFRAALLEYEGYADLTSGPITFKGSPNIAHGATKVSVLEAGANQKMSQVNAGLVDGF